MKIRPIMWLPPLLFAALAAMFLWGMNRPDADVLPSTREGGVVPALTTDEFDGVPYFTRDDLARGEVVLVNFWASWCAPCRAEHPRLLELAQRGVHIYGVNYKDRPEDAARFLADLGNPFEKLAADTSGRTGIDWGIYGVPETFIIDGNGVVVKRFAGPMTNAVIEKIILPAIAEAESHGK